MTIILIIKKGEGDIPLLMPLPMARGGLAGGDRVLEKGFQTLLLEQFNDDYETCCFKLKGNLTFNGTKNFSHVLNLRKCLKNFYH